MNKRINDSGQSLIEFVIVIPVVLMLIFAVLTFGFFVYDRIIVVLASSQAADRAGEIIADEKLTLQEKDAIIKDVAKTFASYIVFTDDYHISVNYEEDKVEVKITSDYTFILPLLSDILKGRLVMPLEYKATYKIL